MFLFTYFATFPSLCRCYRLKGALTEAAEKARMAAGQWGAIEDHGGRIRSLQLLVQIKRYLSLLFDGRLVSVECHVQGGRSA